MGYTDASDLNVMTASSRRRSRPRRAEPSCRRRGRCRSAILLLAFTFLPLTVLAQQPGAGTAREAALKAFAAGQYDQVETLTQVFAQDESLTVLRARALIVQGDYEKAEALLRPIVFESAVGDAALELGLLQKYLGRRGEARRTLEILRLGQGRGTPAQAYLRAARAAHAVGRFEEAKQLLQDATRDAPNDPAANTEWGDLLLEKFNQTEAVKSYQLALKGDADYQPALIGLARAMSDQNSPMAIRFARHALELNPSNPDAHLVLAEIALYDDRKKDASEAIEAALRINARSLEALALRAALAFVDGKQDSYDATVAEALKINPTYGEIYRVTGSVTARYYRFEEAAEQARKAILLDRENTRAMADLGAHLMRTGDERNARRALEQAFRADSYDLVTYNMLGLLDTLEAFETIKDEDLLIKLHRDEAGVMREYVPALAKEALASLSKRWDFTPKGPILIEVFPRHDDFAVRNVGLPGMIGALGACFGRVVTMDSPKARPPGEFNWGATLWHELAHVITLQLSNQRIPRWLTEGISVFEETRAERGWGREMDIPFARALDDNRVLKLRDLNAGFQDPRTISMAYYEASLLVEHIVEVHGDAALRTLVQSFADGITTEEALQRVLKVDIDTLQTSFDGFLTKRFSALRAALTTPDELEPELPLEKVKALAAAHPDSYNVQVALGTALRGQDPEASMQAYERAIALVPQGTGPESPYAQIVQMAKRTNDKDRAAKALEGWTKADHTDVDSARQLTTLLQDMPENKPRMEAALRRLVAVDPFDSAAHSTLGRMALDAGSTEEAIRDFRVALAAGPMDRAAAHTDLAEGLLLTGSRDEAKRQALSALEIAPTYERAQDLLLKLVEAGGDRR